MWIQRSLTVRRVGMRGTQSVARKVRPGHSRDLPARVSYLVLRTGQKAGLPRKGNFSFVPCDRKGLIS